MVAFDMILVLAAVHEVQDVGRALHAADVGRLQVLVAGELALHDRSHARSHPGPEWPDTRPARRTGACNCAAPRPGAAPECRSAERRRGRHGRSVPARMAWHWPGRQPAMRCTGGTGAARGPGGGSRTWGTCQVIGAAGAASSATQADTATYVAAAGTFAG